MKQIHKFLFITLFVLVLIYFLRIFRENDMGTIPSTKFSSLLKQIQNIAPTGPPTVGNAPKIIKICQENGVSVYPSCLATPPADPNDPLGYAGKTPTPDQMTQTFIAGACYKASTIIPGGTIMCPGLAGLPGLEI